VEDFSSTFYFTAQEILYMLLKKYKKENVGINQYDSGLKEKKL